MPEGAPPNISERERVLAAIGWEGDPRRRRVLHSLLAESGQRVYLTGYMVLQHRARAMESTRRTLLKVARSLDRIPEDCSLSAWIFLTAREEFGQKTDCPDPGRTLTSAERELATGGEDIVAAPVRGSTVHPLCLSLIDAYRVHLVSPMDAGLLARSGWSLAAPDLEHFLEAQFGVDAPVPGSARAPWRQVLPAIRWSPSRIVAASVIVLTGLLALFLLSGWDIGKHPAPGGHAVTAADTGALGSPSTPLGSIAGAAFNAGNGDLTFNWKRFPGAVRYRLLVLSPRLDTLYQSAELGSPNERIPLTDHPGLASGGSYLYKVDGVKQGRPIATTGLTPFTLP